MSLHLAKAYLNELLGSIGGRWRDRTRDNPEVIPGLLYRFLTFGGPSNETAVVTLFLRVGSLGGALWEQEMRTLERITGFSHPALPKLLDGGRIDGIDGDVGAAYVRTLRRGGTSASEDWFEKYVANDRGKILSHLWLLADALGILHDASVSHRSLWPGSLIVRESTDPNRLGEIEAVELTRFEMSALLANLFRRKGDASYAQIREAYLANEPVSLLYTPPERLRFVLSRPEGELGGPLGDVYSLGMIAAEWLLTGPPADPVPTAYDDITAFQTETRRRVAIAGGELPGQLRETIHSMLDPDPRSRPTAYQVAQSFAEGFSDAQQALAPGTPTEPYLVAYMAQQSDILILNKWRFIQQSATTDIGRDQLTDLIEQDMRGAEVIYSPNGAIGFASDEKEKLRRAKTVIVGTKITWFCEPFWTPRSGGSIRTFKEMLVIKYVRRTESAALAISQLRVNALIQRVPIVEAEPAPMGDPDTAEFLCEGRPDWATLNQPTQSGRLLTSDEQDYLDSLEWYLKYQSAMLDSRTYAYQIDPGGNGTGRVHLRWDAEADRTRRLPDEQRLSRTAILDTRRPDMARFVSDADDGIDRGKVRLATESSPNWGRAATYEVVDIVQPDIVIISTRSAVRPPDRGWLRLDSDSGTPPQIQRQREALIELAGNRVLLDRLIDPHTEKHPGSWEHAGGTLLGDGRIAVQEILAHAGMFALQGPPGTGKTEVTSQAAVDYLEFEPTARILVSAQSHDALDNLAVRITRKLGITAPPGSRKHTTLDRLALRIQPRRSESEFSAELKTLQPTPLAQAVTEYSQRRSRQWLASRRSELPAMIEVVQRWIQRVPDSQLELTRRVRGAANVVFATTGASTSRNLLRDATSEPFDWVIVEEAGRAWPTELALPLVRGVRWTLVGDHAQIGAYSRADVERFLESLGGYEGDELHEMWLDRDQHSRNFGTFARFFVEGTGRPTKVLKQQYRMEAAISQLVGDVFYADSGGLEAMRPSEFHPLEAPGALTGKRILWIDTGLAQRCVGFWANDHEAAICAALVRAMRPAPGSSDGPSLAVITPYRDQVQRLQNLLSEHYPRIHTIDGFQGREADVVVVSLVRDRSKPGDTPIQAVGHVADPPRINVALSRSRELLIVVGRFEVYANDAGPKWKEVAEHFQRANAVISADDWRID